MNRIFTFSVLCIMTVNTSACVVDDVVTGVMQATETKQERSARLIEEQAQRDKNRRELEERRKREEEERIQALIASFFATCKGYGYVTGTPDFNQCVGNERRAYEQQQQLIAMDKAAAKRAADALEDARDRAAAERRRQRFQSTLDAIEQTRRDSINRRYGRDYF